MGCIFCYSHYRFRRWQWNVKKLHFYCDTWKLVTAYQIFMKIKYDLEAFGFWRLMMSSVATEGKLRQAVSLQGVDPETCMIVFKNHWAQVMYEFHLLCWLGSPRGLYCTEPGFPTCVTGGLPENIGRKPFQVGRKANFSACIPRIGSWLKTLVFMKAIRGHAYSSDIFIRVAVGLQVTCPSLCSTLDHEYILFLSLLLADFHSVLKRYQY